MIFCSLRLSNSQWSMNLLGALPPYSSMLLPTQGIISKISPRGRAQLLPLLSQPIQVARHEWWWKLLSQLNMRCQSSNKCKRMWSKEGLHQSSWLAEGPAITSKMLGSPVRGPSGATTTRIPCSLISFSALQSLGMVIPPIHLKDRGNTSSSTACITLSNSKILPRWREDNLNDYILREVMKS
jgi:hypothetical protein